MFYFSMFFQYMAQYLKTKFEYRADMVVKMFSDLLFQATNLVFILVVFGHTQVLGGWNREEIIFIYLSSSICAIIVLSAILWSAPINSSAISVSSSTLTIGVKRSLPIDSISADVQCGNFNTYFIIKSLD